MGSGMWQCGWGGLRPSRGKAEDAGAMIWPWQGGLMIVSTYFDGDGDLDLHVQWLQHDVYSEALGIISRTCQGHIRNAHALLDYWEGWELVERFDHRTLQLAHDLLAAVWRFRYEMKFRQYELPFEVQKPLFEQPRGDEPDFVGRWLTWLQEQVDSWIHDSERVRLVVTILRPGTKLRRPYTGTL